MGCNPTDQDHQTDPQHEEKVPWGNLADEHGIDKHVSPRPSIDLPGVALRFLALFTIDPHPVLRLLAGTTIIRKLHLLSQSKVE